MAGRKLDRKYYIMIAIVYAAVFLIYNIIVLPLFGDKNGVFWTSYAFMFLGFAAVIAVTFITFKSVDVEAVFMNIPLMSLSIFYFCAELFASFVFMIARNVAPLPLALAVQAILLLAFIIVAVMALIEKDAVQSINQNVDKKSKSIKILAGKVKLLEDQCLDSELKAELHKVSEAIRYSDPMTTEVTEDLDDMINGKVKELKLLCADNNKNEAMQTCYKLASYIAERNMLLKNSK